MRGAFGVALVLAVAAAAPARADDATTRHLLAGVRAFKDARYEDALVELRVVQRSLDAPADLAFYLGPTLVKLGRDREAVTVFVTSSAPRDALSDFYLGEAYYHARLYLKARGVFADLRARGLGPALDEAAGRYVAGVDTTFELAPADAVIDAYVALAREAAREPVFAAELWDEARLLDARAALHRRHAEIVGELAAAWNASGRTRLVIELFAGDPARGSEGDWQLARAYAQAADPAHARPLLEAIARGTGAHAGDAAGMLASLPP